MILSDAISVVLGILSTAFTVSADAEVPYVRMLHAPKGVHVVKINNAADYNIEPFVVDELTSAKQAYDINTMKLILNAGFFDPNNGETISYVVKDKQIVLDPTTNEALMKNPELTPYLDSILNRGEFRVLNCSGKKSYDIAYHNDAVSPACEIVHSIQAGPILDERMDLEKEYFVIKDGDKVLRDSISAQKKLARTAIGIKSNDLYLFIVTDENPMTIEELKSYMKKRGMEKTLAFDGGSSTSFENGALSVTSDGDNLGRKVKSFLILKHDY